MKKINLTSLWIVFLSFWVAIVSYNFLPDQIATHWNSAWEVDSYMSKFLWLFIFPFVFLFIYLLFLIVPKIDPLKKNIEKFRKYFDTFILVILLFLFYIYLLSIFWNLWYEFQMNYMIAPAISILFYFTWILMQKAKRNWFIGIRTPWTLSSDKVWNKTHKIWAKWFKILSIITLIWIFFWEGLQYFIIVPILIFLIFLFVYSYLEYQKINKK